MTVGVVACALYDRPGAGGGRGLRPSLPLPDRPHGLAAALLWLSDGSRSVVATVIVGLNVLVLIGTGLLVLALARRTTVRAGAGLAACPRICLEVPLGLLGIPGTA
jgi:hypothetical protein